MANQNTGYKNQGGFGQAANESKPKVPDAASSVVDKAKDAASSVMDKAKDAASSVADKAKGMATSAVHSVENAASNLGHQATDTAANLGHKADDAVGSVGGSMKNLAGTVREKAPHDGMMGSAASSVAGALESGGQYIHDEKLSGMANDFAKMLKGNPLMAIGIGFGLGFLVAQMLPSSRR